MGLYRLLTDLGSPLIASLLRHRLAAGREDPDRFQERLGYASEPRPQGPLVWFHAASVGEVMSVLTLLKALKDANPSVSFFVTTGTVASARLLVERLPAGVFHQYYPVDRWPYVERFLNHWKPDLALWVESELWPNMLEAMRRRKIPAVLVNGRISPKSFRRWRFFRGFIRRILSAFTLCLVQTEDERARFEKLGAPNVQPVGNIKYAAAPLDCDIAELESLQTQIGDRPCWIMASTHTGEDEIARDVHRRLAKKWPNILTIIAPRHPVRAAAIQRMLAEEAPDLSCVRRTSESPLLPDTAIYLADTMGEMGLFYRLAPVTGLAGSFTWGGHNPVEPAQLGSVVITGPRMDNFDAMTKELLDAKAIIQVATPEALAEAVESFLLSGEESRQIATRALAFTSEKSKVMAQILDTVTPLLHAAIEATHENPDLLVRHDEEA